MPNNQKAFMRDLSRDLKELFNQIKINVALFLLLTVYAICILIDILHDLPVHGDILILVDVLILVISVIGSFFTYRKKAIGYILMVGIVSFTLINIVSLFFTTDYGLQGALILLSKSSYLIVLLLAFVIFRKHVITAYKVKVWIILLVCIIALSLSLI